MKYVKAYLGEHRRLLLALAALLPLAAFLAYLYGLPAAPLLYILLVCAVVGFLCFAAPGFFSYARHIRELERLQNDPTALPELSLPLREALWAQACRDLLRKLRETENRWAGKQRDLLEYYTLWVHQIKTPLSAIRLILQSSPPGEEREALSQELFKVERYVEMVLGYLRLESMSADLLLEKVSVRQTARQAVKKFAPQFIYKKISLDFQEFDNRVITDEKWLLFTLEQILSNALKYTPEGGSVSVSMDENDVLTVADTGIGISPEDLPRVFERGFTGFNGRREKTSTGLGLYLTKEILDKLQTPIEILSQPGQGTQVRFYLHRDPLSVF